VTRKWMQIIKIRTYQKSRNKIVIVSDGLAGGSASEFNITKIIFFEVRGFFKP
jgi:hypothetical protein